MPPVACSRCQSLNPEGALYCHEDGTPLMAQAGPVAIHAQRFPHPLVFTSGQHCWTFDEVVLACESDWAGAVKNLRDGLLRGFLMGLGRADLAQAAEQAATDADPDRGLDRFLSQLPSTRRAPAELLVEPLEHNLGKIARGSDRRLVVSLKNKGQGLLTGSITADVPWLALGEAPGSPKKVFQARQDYAVPVQVRGKALRASPQAQEGRLVIESNGGQAVVVFRVQVPAQPYPDGVLAGAETPRELAKKAQAAPREAVVLFEKGKVAAWYEANGWEYPVKGPIASGLAAIEQFYQALGLVQPPTVTISEQTINLQGLPGQTLTHAIEVRTPEQRNVFAHASSNAAWLQVGATQGSGRSIRLPLQVTVPAGAAGRLVGKVMVTANGNQRFPVEVTVTVAGQPAPPPRAERPGLLKHLAPLAVIVLGFLGVLWHDFSLPPKQEEKVLEAPPLPVHPEPYIAVKFDDTMRFSLEEVVEGGKKNKKLTFGYLNEKLRLFTNNTCLRIDARDCLFGDNGNLPDKTKAYVPGFVGSWEEKEKPFSPDPENPSLGKGWLSIWNMKEPSLRITQKVAIIPGDAIEKINGKDHLRLDTCRVLYVIENKDSKPHDVGIRFLLDTYIGQRDGVPFLIPGRTGLCQDKERFDTLGQVPNYIQACENDKQEDPGTVARVQFRLGGGIEPPSRVTLGGWPDFRLNAHLNVKGCNNAWTLWDVPHVSMQEIHNAKDKDGKGLKLPPDSAVTIYWDPKPLPPAGRREVGFSYGLGSVASTGGKVGLTVGGEMVPGGQFTLTAQVRDPVPNEKLRLRLPAGGGLKLLDGEEQEVPRPPAGERDSTVTWRLEGVKIGRYKVEVDRQGKPEKIEFSIKPLKSFLN
jgi:hypothetical protein